MQPGIPLCSTSSNGRCSWDNRVLIACRHAHGEAARRAASCRQRRFSTASSRPRGRNSHIPEPLCGGESPELPQQRRHTHPASSLRAPSSTTRSAHTFGKGPTGEHLCTHHGMGLHDNPDHGTAVQVARGRPSSSGQERVSSKGCPAHAPPDKRPSWPSALLLDAPGTPVGCATTWHGCVQMRSCMPMRVQMETRSAFGRSEEPHKRG